VNQRIRQLLNEATVGLEPDLSTHTTITHNELAKFAKLIVKECASRVDNILRERRDGGGTMGDEIREHFGVEE